jgi:hypothetical protein
VRRHLSAESLALHREGAVSAAEADYITAHLAACPRCSAIDAQLADLPTLLGAIPTTPMPEVVVARIQMAIASESTARSATNRAAGPRTTDASDRDSAPRSADKSAPAGVPGRPDLPLRRRRYLPRVRMPDWSSPLVLRGLAAAGAVVVIVGAGMVLANSHSASTSSASGSGAAQGSPRARPTAHGGFAANGPSAAGSVGVNYLLNGQAATTTALVSETNYTRQSLPGEVRREVASHPAMGRNTTAGAAPQAHPSPASLPEDFHIAQLEGCLNTVADGHMVLITEIARYLGTPAAIIVLRVGDARPLHVVVVGFACSASNPAIITTLEVPAG